MKTAFVMSGGGAKGAYQLGVLKQLSEQGITPDVIYGTSVGAINGMGYAYGGIAELEANWRGIIGQKWYTFWNPSEDILSLNPMLFCFGCTDGIYNLNPLHAHLAGLIPNTPSCEVIAVRCSLNTGVTDFVSNKKVPPLDFLDAVIASGAIPGVMSPVGEWVDGGCRDVSAIQQAIDDGADKVYAILCNPLTINPTDTYDVSKTSIFLKFLRLAYRSVDGVMEHQIWVSSNQQCYVNKSGIPITIYCPSVVPCSTLQFDPKIIASTIQMGYTTVPYTI